MSGVKFYSSGYKDTINKLRKAARMAPRGAQKATRSGAIKLRNMVRENIQAEGLVDTGQYLDSIHVGEVIREGSAASASVETDAPQALRLEYGFVGIDALGRHYAQPPFPHWRPAMTAFEATFGQMVYKFTIGEFDK